MALLAVMIPTFVIFARRTRGDLRRICLRTSRYSRWAVRILGLRQRTSGERQGAKNDQPSGRLIVANHTSWIDPLLFAARRPAVFVTSLEVEGDALLGRICAAAGCLFVDRRAVGGLRGTCARITEILHAHHDVVVFPEATSSDGRTVLPFRPAAFAAALAASAPVQPVALAHSMVDGRPALGRRRDQVCWYGAMRFLPHLTGFLAGSGTVTDLHWLAPAGSGDRKQVALATHQRIAGALRELQIN